MIRRQGNVEEIKNRISSLQEKQKQNKELLLKDIKKREELKKCAENIFSSSNGLKVLKHLYNIKHSYCDINLLDANPNKIILANGIRFFYNQIRELLKSETIYKVELEN